MRPYQVVTAALRNQGYRPVGTGDSGTDCKAFCPAHPDDEGTKQKSLTVSWKDDKVLFHCWSQGCQPPEIIRALGLSWEEVYEGYELPHMRLYDKPKRRPGRPQKQKPARKVEKDWDEVFEADRALAHSKWPVVELLAQDLGVTVDSLDKLGCGFRDAYKDTKARWTFPFRDPNGKIVGMQRRWLNGDKKSDQDSYNCLFFTSDLPKVTSGYIFNVEGVSCTAAGVTMGLQVVGRSSALTNGEEFAELVAPACWEGTATVIIMGENEPAKGDAKVSAGLAGMRRVAQETANRLGADVLMALPPDGAKDMRAWLNAQHADLADWKSIAELGVKFINLVINSAETVRPENMLLPLCEYSRKDVVTHTWETYSDGSCMCRHRYCLQLHDKKDHDHKQVAFARCLTWGCEGCRRVMRRRWLSHLLDKLYEHKGSLYVWRGVPKNWDTLTGQIRRLKGRYLRINLPFGRILLITTVLPKVISGAVETPVTQVDDLIAEAIHRDMVCKKNCITASRPWTPRFKEAASKQWEKDGSLKGTSPARIIRILREHGVEFKESIPPIAGQCYHRIYFTVPKNWTKEQRITFDLAIIADYVDFASIKGSFCERPGLPEGGERFRRREDAG